MTTTALFLLLSLAPALATMLGLVVVALLVARSVAHAEAAYSPDRIDDAEEWRARIELSLGERGWWQGDAPQPTMVGAVARKVITLAQCLIRCTVRAYDAIDNGRTCTMYASVAESNVHAIARMGVPTPGGEGPRGRDPPAHPGGHRLGPRWIMKIFELTCG